MLFVCFEFKLSVLELAAGVMLGKAPSFSCLTVNNYLAKLLDPESTKYTTCTLCIPSLAIQMTVFKEEEEEKEEGHYLWIFSCPEQLNR